MELDTELLRLIKRKRIDEIENEWFSRLESNPEDTEWFVEVARGMCAAKTRAKMAELIALRADALAEKQLWKDALDALAEGVRLSPQDQGLRTKTIEILRARHADREDLEEVLELFALEEATDPVRVFTNLRDWLRFERDAGFFLFGKGLGKVVATNLGLQKVTVRFEKGGSLVARADEAKRLITHIPENHFMMERLSDPDRIRELAKADPGEILREVFAVFHRPLSAGEIRECLTGVVEGAKWTSWWARARKHPQLLPARGRKNAFAWSHSPDAAEDAILVEFEGAPLAVRVELARKHARRGGRVKDVLIAGLREDLSRCSDELSRESLEMDCLLEELASDHEAVFPLESILAREDGPEILSSLPDRRHREAFHRRIRKICPDDWPTLHRTLFFAETDYRLMSALYDELLTEGPEGSADRLVADALAVPRRRPHGFVWVTRQVLARDELKSRATLGLISRILDALELPEFKTLRTPLREHFEEDGLAFAVFDMGGRAEADRLLSTLDSAGGLEDHRKTTLRRKIFRAYPDIRKRKSEDSFHATMEAVEAKRAELDDLVKVQIPQNAEAIRIAREEGDLRENFEYHAARQKHELLNTRAAQLDRDLRRVRVIDRSSVDVGSIAVGTTATLAPTDGGDSIEVTILGPWDSDPDARVFSHLSDLALGLLGTATGEGVDLEEKSYRVESIRVASQLS
ncbi:MAG: GreA/GreB family elongation factor [Gemmatimonadota bacterium]|nr:GreA/GreB family elongation factor [Gemmatimonadota bacterium]MDP7031674.1 GreA/GreB family elongation factor [Gemmatimonadota bacterium]